MNLFIRTLFISLAVFLFHMLAIFLLDSGGSEAGYYSGLGAVIFYFFFGYWGYFILSAIYIYISKKDSQRKAKCLKAFIIILMGYLLFRIPDIIDNDFFQKFDFRVFFLFLISIPILVELEYLLRKKFKPYPINWFDRKL